MLRGFLTCIVLDVDMLLRDDAPDLFGIVPTDSVGMYDEGSAFHHSVGSDLKQIEMRHEVYCHLIDYCGFDPSPVSGAFSFDRPLRYYNMGVVVYNREAMNLHGSIPQELVEAKEYEMVRDDLIWKGEGL